MWENSTSASKIIRISNLYVTRIFKFIIILCASLILAGNHLSVLGKFSHFYAWLAHSTTFESTIKLGALNISLATGKMVNTYPYGMVCHSAFNTYHRNSDRTKKIGASLKIEYLVLIINRQGAKGYCSCLVQNWMGARLTAWYELHTLKVRCHYAFLGKLCKWNV